MAFQKFALISEPHLPSEHLEGCLSASLCQSDEQGAFHVLSHASRQFKDHEANYPPFLIDMANTLYGMDVFDRYLLGQPFILYMDEQPQPELSHLHKKTYAHFHAVALQYNFVIQNKTGSGVPLHLRTTPPSKINAMAPDNTLLLQAQEEDPDMQLIKKFCMTTQWPTSLNPDHQIKLEDLNRNLLIDQHGPTWVHCPGRGPDVPTLKALYLPIKYRQPVTCNFWQRHHNVPVKNQMQQLQENYCWLGMREDIAEHSQTCNDCQVLQQAKKSPQIPNATVHLDTHEPFVLYGDNKFVVTLTDEGTKITVFGAIKSKTIESLAHTTQNSSLCRPRTE